MGNFFSYASTPETEQKRFLDAITNRRHVIASFPLGYPTVSLYAFSVMLSGGMSVAVASDSRSIRRNMEYFKTAGFHFPEIVFLDGAQMPHEERAIRDAINHNRVRLLYTTPERFTSLTFLEILVRTEISFLVIEEANRLLPSSPGYERHHRLWAKGLEALHRLPPLLLLTPPLSVDRVSELAAKLNLEEFQRIEREPAIDAVSLRVETLWSEHQKFQKLTEALAGYPGRGRMGHLEKTGPALIQAGLPAQAEKLGASLIDYGFQTIGITHTRQSAEEQQQVFSVARRQENAIIVNGGVDTHSWLPLRESNPQVIYWMPPASLDELFITLFRHLPVLSERPVHRTGEGDDDEARPSSGLKGLILYTKEDFHRMLSRLRYRNASDRAAREAIASDFTAIHERALALKRYRRWVLSEGCRLQTLLAYYQGGESPRIAPCGQCDACRIARLRSKRHPIQQLIRTWLL